MEKEGRLPHWEAGIVGGNSQGRASQVPVVLVPVAVGQTQTHRDTRACQDSRGAKTAISLTCSTAAPGSIFHSWLGAP